MGESRGRGALQARRGVAPRVYIVGERVFYGGVLRYVRGRGGGGEKRMQRLLKQRRQRRCSGCGRLPPIRCAWPVPTPPLQRIASRGLTLIVRVGLRLVWLMLSQYLGVASLLEGAITSAAAACNVRRVALNW